MLAGGDRRSAVLRERMPTNDEFRAELRSQLRMATEEAAPLGNATMTMTDAKKLFFAGGAHARAAHALLPGVGKLGLLGFNTSSHST